MTSLSADLDQFLLEAHLPALLMSLVHLTGDATLLSPERRPEYVFMADGKLGGYSPDVQADIRARAKAAILAHMAGAPLPERPSPQTVRRMMDWVAGADIPDHYAAKRAAEGMKVIVVGAGMSGLLTGIRLKQAGVPFEIIEKNADAGGTWFENVYPGCRVDNPNHM
jgi:4-hydroxyacetophenone monooxygenase